MGQRSAGGDLERRRWVARAPVPDPQQSDTSGIDPLFSESNDFLFPVFAGLFIANTNASVVIGNPAPFDFTYLPTYFGGLQGQGLPLTNTLQIQVYNASDVTLWGGSDITGWFFFDDYGPEGGLPMANVIFWDVTNSLIADNTFVGQGSSLLMMNGDGNGGGNVIWGNTFEDGLQAGAFLYDGAPVGI